jgi:hypothetical protein
VLPHRLRYHREAEDRDERVESQVCRFTDRAGQPILRENGGAKVDGRGADKHDHDRQQHRHRTDQHFTHPHIVAYRAVMEALEPLWKGLARALRRPLRSASSPR